MFFNSISISKPPKNPLTIQKITKTQKKTLSKVRIKSAALRIDSDSAFGS